MKVKVLLFIVIMSLPLYGCRPESEESPDDNMSKITAKALSEKNVTNSKSSGDNELIVFTGNDILWFDEITKELRFKDNYSNNPQNNNPIWSNSSIRFYFDSTYLFSSIICVASLNSQIHNSLVFYYSITENKYYLMDGYPAASVLSNPQVAQETRDQNMRKIAAEWNIFVEQLKKEGRYKP